MMAPARGARRSADGPSGRRVVAGGGGRRRRRSRAFTLAELLVVVTLSGLLLAMLSGGYRGVLPAARMEVAISKARTLNAARSTYALAVPGAAEAWAAAEADAERVALLIAADVLDGTPTDYLSSAGGYTLSLAGQVRAATVLRRAGVTLSY